MAEEVTELTPEEQEQLERILGKIPGGELLTGGRSSHNPNGQDTTELIVYQPEISFRRRDIQPFAPTYVGVNDHLAVEITNTIPGAEVIVRLRFQSADGSIMPMERRFHPPVTGQPSLYVIHLREGWLYGISVSSVGIPSHRAAYVRVGLQYGTEPGGFVYNWWFADIVNDAYTPSWPVGRHVSPRELRISEISPTPSIYFAVTDEIVLTIYNSVVNQTVRLRGKFLSPDGNVVPLDFAWAPPADRSQHLASFTPGEGFLQSLEILPDLDTKRGQLWVRAAHRRVSNGVLLFETTLAQGYVSTAQPLNWPGWNMEHSTSGRGVSRFITLSAPPGGSTVSAVVPTNAIWYIKTAVIGFQADASTGDRYIHLYIYEPGGQLIYNVNSGYATRAYQLWYRFYSTSGVFVPNSSGGYEFFPLPVDIYLTEGSSVVAKVYFVRPGDQITHFNLCLEEWINP